MSLTSDFYLARAEECVREAADTSLQNVRERCRRSEQAWRSMAARIVRGETMRTTNLDDKIANSPTIDVTPQRPGPITA